MSWRRALSDTDLQLLSRLPEELHEAHGLPTDITAADRVQALSEVRELLAAELVDLQTSALGVEWSATFHARVRHLPDDHRLLAAGWLPLRRLPARIGGGRDAWLMTAPDRVRVRVEVGPEVDPVVTLLRRCQQRGAVRLVDVLELRALQRAGCRVPAHRAVTGAERLVTALQTGADPHPIPLGRRRKTRRVVAVSGVDGSGKSTLVRQLVKDLDRAGVAHSVVWARPGIGLERLDGVLRWVKRRGGNPSQHERSTVASQVPSAPPPEVHHSPLRKVWSWVVAGVFLAKVRGRHVRAHGVVVYDRHVPDALASLAYFYGSTHRRSQLWFVRAGMPKARHRFYLAVDADLALARDPTFPLGPEAIQAQLTQYERWLDRSDFTRLDATASPGELSMTVLRALTAPG